MSEQMSVETSPVKKVYARKKCVYNGHEFSRTADAARCKRAMQKYAAEMGIKVDDNECYTMRALIPKGLDYEDVSFNHITQSKTPEKAFTRFRYYLFLRYLRGAIEFYKYLTPFKVYQMFSYVNAGDTFIARLLDGGHIRLTGSLYIPFKKITVYSYELNLDMWETVEFKGAINYHDYFLYKTLKNRTRKKREKLAAKIIAAGGTPKPHVEETLDILDLTSPYYFGVEKTEKKKQKFINKLAERTSPGKLIQDMTPDDIEKASPAFRRFIEKGKLNPITTQVNSRFYDDFTHMNKEERKHVELDGEKLVEAADMPIGSFTMLLGAIAKKEEVIQHIVTDKAAHEAACVLKLIEISDDPKEELCKRLGITATKKRSASARLKSFIRNWITCRENGTIYRKNGKTREYRFRENQLSAFIAHRAPDLRAAMENIQNMAWRGGYSTIYHYLEYLEHMAMAKVFSEIEGFRVHDAIYCKESDAEKAVTIMRKVLFAI